MRISKRKFVDAILLQDYETVQRAIDAGFDVNAPIRGQGPMVEAAMPAEDPKILRMLWKAGAKPTVPWLEIVFSNFEKGATDEEAIPTFDDEDESPDLEDLEDLTKGFSVARLEINKGVLEFSGVDSCVTLTVAPFALDGEAVETEITLDGIELPKTLKAISGKTFRFPKNPEEGYIDGSMMLREAHNPVDATSIEFGEYESKGKQILATLDLEFNFSFEGIGFDDEKRKVECLLDVER